MSIELRHIKYALAAAEFRSFRRAAAALSVQQSTVSRQVRELEDAIGVSIFFRSSGGIELTPAGRSFLTRAKYGVDEILFATNDALATGRGQLGTVRIGILSSLASGFLPQLLKAFAEAHPGVVVSLVEGRVDSHIAAVQRHRLDVAFVAGEPELLDCEATLLWAERVFVALSEGHP